MFSNTKNMKGIYFLKGLGFVALGVLFVFIVGTVVLFLWNSLMPTLFGLTVITYWQAIGLLILSRLLVGGMGKGRGGHPRHKWKNHMRSRWGNMSAEEKAEMKSKFRHRYDKYCGPEDVEYREEKNEPND
jgi:hypothetical protein